MRKNKAEEQFCRQGLRKVERSETDIWKWEAVSGTAQQESQRHELENERAAVAGELIWSKKVRSIIKAQNNAKKVGHTEKRSNLCPTSRMFFRSLLTSSHQLLT